MIASADLQQLLARVALGDRVAFRRIYDATAPSLFGVALRIVRQRDRAEEVLQDAFVNVWNRAAGYPILRFPDVPDSIDVIILGRPGTRREPVWSNVVNSSFAWVCPTTRQ